MLEKFSDATVDLFKFLIASNPLAAILFILVVVLLWVLKTKDADNKTLNKEKVDLLISMPQEKETALLAQQKRYDDLIALKDKEIALLHAEFAELTRDNTTVMRGMEQALVSGNHKSMIASIYKATMVIGTKHGIPLTELGMNLTADT